MQLTWLGHSACHLHVAGKSVLIDPFFSGPTFPQGFEERLEAVDYILLTHGHEDHGIGEAPRLAKRYGATVVGQFEIVSYLHGQGVEAIEPMNLGGTVEGGGLAFTMVNALHSSTFTHDGRPLALGTPAGFVISSSETVVYHAGDTEIFSDMALIQRLHEPRIGLIPIGDRFTMGPKSAALACNEFLDLEVVVPIHWGTFPFLSGDPQTFKGLVRRGKVLLPAPGEPLDL